MIIGDSMRKVLIDNEIVEIDDSPLDPYETGRIIAPSLNEDLEDTAVIETIDEEDLLNDTNTDIFGDQNE